MAATEMTLQERLRLWVAWLKRRAMIETAHVVEEAAAELDRLQARVAELEAAVKPFAALAKHYPLKRKYGNRPNAGELFEVASAGIGAASYSVEDLHAAYRAIHGEDA